MIIEVGDILQPTTIDAQWTVLAIIGNAVCIQSSDELVDKYGSVQAVNWFNKKELENSKNIKKL